MAATPERCGLHCEDETHPETNPYPGRVGHRVGQQPIPPAAGTDRRLTVFGSAAARGRGRVEGRQARADPAGLARPLAALDARHAATGREAMLVSDDGSCHTSQVSKQALAARADWLEVVPLARYSPALDPKGREWRVPKRDHRSHPAPTLRASVADLVAGLGRLGGERCDIVDEVPDWWTAGHRKEPTGRPPGRPKGAEDAAPRTRRTNLAAPT